MEPEIRNLLYRRPELYEAVYPEPGEATPAMCRRMFDRFLAAPPRSILDLGCGTARDLAALSRDCPDGCGIDRCPEMLAFARTRHPHLDLRAGDMRTVRVGRTFDAVLCMGSAFMYNLGEEDIAAALDTFAVHAHPGSLLILDLNNAAAYLGGTAYRETMEQRIDIPGFRARAEIRHAFDRRRQRAIRRRTWHVEGGDTVDDYCEYRLFFPAELEHLLREKGFAVLGMFDNKRLRETDLSGLRLYVAARREGPLVL